MLYANRNGRVAHELIFDLRPFKLGAGGKLGLRLEDDRIGDLRLAPPETITAPLLGQIQTPAQRQRAALADRVHADRDLAVTDLAERARVLALHPRRVPAVLDTGNNHNFFITHTDAGTDGFNSL